MLKLPSHFGEYSRFFLPLAFQSAAQSFSYPLVGMVASNGPGGTLNLAGFAQANSVMFLLGTIGSGLLTTGMVFSKSVQAHKNFEKVSKQLGLFVVLMQLLLNIPFISKFIFETAIGLPVTISEPARMAFLATIPLNFLFFIRNPSFVLLYNSKSTKLAGITTLFRIMLTILTAPIYVHFGLTGVLWAVVCQTVPVAIETYLAYRFSRKHYKELPISTNEPVPTTKKLLLFNLPLSLGGLFLALSSMSMGAFIARAAHPEIMLSVYYLAIGLVNPMSFAVNRIQAVVLTFPPLFSKDNRTLHFGLLCGAIGGLLPLIFIIPGLADFYYIKLQNLSPENLKFIRQTAFALVFVPFTVAFRLHSEGLAAHFRRPTTILAGQAVYLGSMVTVSFFSLNIGISGNLIGPIAVSMANLFAALTVRYSLLWERSDNLPVPKVPSVSPQ
ncbi:MAG: hypothetical protein JNL74_24520 [Fibrobacteres bacterium]|nr:hypothetical protein [Fibrobacterota bacterium]